MEEYEKCRRSGPYKRRHRNDLRISGDDRIQLLLDNQCATIDEMDVAMSEAEKIRKSRMKNSHGSGYGWGTKSLDLIAIAKETVNRKFKMKKRSTLLIVGSSNNKRKTSSSPTIRGCLCC